MLNLSMAKKPLWRSIEPHLMMVCLLVFVANKEFDGPFLLSVLVLAIGVLSGLAWSLRSIGGEEDHNLSWRWPFIRPIQKESSPDSSSGPQDELNSKT